jgi:hypothetical protein
MYGGKGADSMMFQTVVAKHSNSIANLEFSISNYIAINSIPKRHSSGITDIRIAIASV